MRALILPESYDDLLLTPEWQRKREKILQRDGYRCLSCNSSRSLQVHHRQYIYDTAKARFKAPWDYDDLNLITLCDTCHSKGHELYEVPKFNI
ncbi:MAG: HNH endonuclease [Bacteroidetes bacterium]|nr:HNH endonuclease [Bacteroidota bacterium]